MNASRNRSEGEGPAIRDDVQAITELQVEPRNLEHLSKIDIRMFLHAPYSTGNARAREQFCGALANP